MFSGIVREIGRIASTDGKQLVISCSAVARQGAMGSSVSVSGVCLTAARILGNELVFDVMPETLRKTTLGEKKLGDAVNLEPSLRVGDELGGHFVYGHADGVGEIVEMRHEADAVLVTIRILADSLSYMAPQGSVAVDGVSLTVARLDTDTITVSLVSYTMMHTTLGAMKTGDRVNIECDMLAKYVQRRDI